MEVLSQILNKIKEGGILQGFYVGLVNTTGIRTSHLLFVDDIIFFSVMLLGSSCSLLGWL